MVFLDSEAIARQAVELAADKQASAIVLLDVKKVCSFADYFVICTGESERQIEAIWEAVVQGLKEKGVACDHTEGAARSGWVLADFNSVVVHMFGAAERDYYQLDRLWSQAIPVLRMQ